MKTACLIAVSLCLPLSLPAQAVVESAVITAGSAAAAGGASGVGKSIGGVFNSLNKTLAKTKESSASPTASPAAPDEVVATQIARAEPAPEAPKREPIDFTAVKPGMARTELIEKAGSPSLKITRNDGPAFLETMWYEQPGKPDTVIRLKNGVVDRVEASSK